MENTASRLHQDKSTIIFEIPNFHEFGEILHDRLHAVLYHIEEISEKFMLITNLFDRDPDRLGHLKLDKEKDREQLTYTGTIRQRYILERHEPTYYINRLRKKGKKWDLQKWREERHANWNVLYGHRLTRDLKEVETFQFFDDFRDGLLDETSIKVSRLSDYFASLDNELKVNEEPIIDDYFSIQEDLYIGIPLLGMGLFQGIVWVIFPKAMEGKFKDEARIRRIIKIFQIEYDNLAMDWDVQGENITRKSFFEEVIKNVNPRNPIQKYIGIKKYYEITDYYHHERVTQNDAVLNRLKAQHVKTAIITILLDSFAHNISAHSLTTLSWWFRERAGYQQPEGKEIITALGRNYNPIIAYTNLVKNRPLARELYPLFKFLLEKGAFWSSITRQTNFAGKISSLYNVLWFDFVNNPLYLGTIANTEEVRKLFINLTIYEKEETLEKKRFKNRKIIKTDKNGQLLDGTFAIINLEDFETESEDKERSLFVEKGPLFDALKEELHTYKVFFPGGVVGKHAFFTLLENEIRNVKHYKGEVLASIQKNGLILNISIHERPIDSSAKLSSSIWELYKIGVWLKHPVDVTSDLVLKRIEGLDSDIVTEDTFQPKLGGNFQDKICSSLLLANSFDRVQDNISNLGEIYYPWIKTACYHIRKDQKTFVEFEVSQRRYNKATPDEFDASFSSEAGSGYLKKYFHLWKGEEILHLENVGDIIHRLELDNESRYRFLYVPDLKNDQLVYLKSKGVIRVLQQGNLPDSIESAYQAWLPQWLKTKGQSVVIDFKEGKTFTGRITYSQGEIKFANETEIEEIATADDDSAYRNYQSISNRIEIAIEHGSKLTAASDKFNYRSHGELMTKFCEGKSLTDMTAMPTERIYELFETLATRMCIFDRRIYNRLYTGHAASETGHIKVDQGKLDLQLARLELYRKHLFLNFQNELLEHFRKVQKEGFLQYNFVVLHLSFIEGMEDKEGKKYRENRIIDFIKNEILQGVEPEKVGNDFILIITTGRGRMAWWDRLRKEPTYARFTTFRPIESIIGCVEDAMQKPDDIDLKYYLTKLFFGS